MIIQIMLIVVSAVVASLLALLVSQTGDIKKDTYQIREELKKKVDKADCDKSRSMCHDDMKEFSAAFNGHGHTENGKITRSV